MPTAKAQSLARQLKEDLALRLSSLGATLDVDASGYPTVTVGDNSAPGNQAAFIRVREEEVMGSLNKDSLGLTQNVYTPHVIQVAVETSGTAGVTLVTLANLSLLLGEVMKHGTKVELWLEDNGTAPTVTTFSTASKKKQTWDHLYHPLTSTM